MGYYKSEFTTLFREIYRSPRNLYDRIFRAGTLGLSFAIYPIILFSEDSDGTRLVSPHGVLEHLALIPVAAAATLGAVSVAFFIAMTAVHGRKLRWVHFALGMLGLRASAKVLKSVKEYTEMLGSTPPSLDTNEKSMVLARMLEKFTSSVVPDHPYTTAWWRSHTLLRTARELVAAHLDYLESDDAFHSALMRTTEKHHVIFGDVDKPLDQTLVYTSVSGQVLDYGTLVLMKRYLVAGEDPLQWEPHYNVGQIRVGMRHGYSALLCLPRWVCETHLAFEQFGPDPAPANGTYKDTVAYLWSADRHNMYHQPTKLVAAAKRLDMSRRGDLELFVA